MDSKVRQRLLRALAVVDEHGTTGTRLLDEAARFWRRAQMLLRLGLLPPEHDSEALELACWALQLPMRDSRLLPAGKLGRTNLRERAEQAAELLVTVLSKDIADDLLDRTTRLILQIPHRAPALAESRLLADAINLDDFGVAGQVMRIIQLGLQGAGVTQVADANEKREEYGYWEARLKDGFHFEPVRDLARRRLERTRQINKLLAEELKDEDKGA